MALTFRSRDFALFDTNFRVSEREDDDGVGNNDNLFLIGWDEIACAVIRLGRF